MSAGAWRIRVAPAIVAALLCIVPVGYAQSRSAGGVGPSASENTAGPRAEILWSFDSGG